MSSNLSSLPPELTAMIAERVLDQGTWEDVLHLRATNLDLKAIVDAVLQRRALRIQQEQSFSDAGRLVVQGAHEKAGASEAVGMRFFQCLHKGFLLEKGRQLPAGSFASLAYWKEVDAMPELAPVHIWRDAAGHAQIKGL
jgi:hypothetical protein